MTKEYRSWVPEQFRLEKEAAQGRAAQLREKSAARASVRSSRPMRASASYVG